MPNFYGAIDLLKNELRNAVIQNSAAPSSPVAGQIYFDSGAAKTLYYYNGTTWVAASGASPGTTVTNEAIGDIGVVGSLTTFAREDHKHGMPSFGSPTTAETSFGLSVSNGSSVAVARSDHTHGSPVHDAGAHSAIPISALAAATGPINMNNNRIMGVVTTLGTDAVNKNYVDNAIAGLSWKDSVAAATTANITLSGNQTIDGVAITSQRVLVKNQTTASQNGLYDASSGAWTRCTDADLGSEISGAAVYVEQGTTQADTAWTLTTDAPIVIDSTALTFAQFGGGSTVVAGAGLTKTGSSIDVIAGDTSLIVNADELHVNTAVIATVASLAAYSRKFAAALTGTASPETVTHNLNTQDIMLMVHNGSSPFTAVEVDWDATTVNTAVVRYNPNLGAGYRVVVMG